MFFIPLWATSRFSMQIFQTCELYECCFIFREKSLFSPNSFYKQKGDHSIDGTVNTERNRTEKFERKIYRIWKW